MTTGLIVGQFPSFGSYSGAIQPGPRQGSKTSPPTRRMSDAWQLSPCWARGGVHGAWPWSFMTPGACDVAAVGSQFGAPDHDVGLFRRSGRAGPRLCRGAFHPRDAWLPLRWTCRVVYGGLILRFMTSEMAGKVATGAGFDNRCANFRRFGGHFGGLLTLVCSARA